MLTFHNHQQHQTIDLKQWQKLKVKHVLHRKLICYLRNDVGSWSDKATEETIDFWEQQDSKEFQHLHKEYKNCISRKYGNKLRYRTSSIFYLQCFDW